MSKIDLCPRLGIMGGLGPLAGVDFYRQFTLLTPASCDADHIPAVLLSLPQIPDRSAAILADTDAPFAGLATAADLLNGMGVEFIAIPCNSAHHWYERLAARSRAKILHIADAAVAQLRECEVGPNIAIMATCGTLASGFYQRRLMAAGYRFSNPVESCFQDAVENAVCAVKAGEIREARGFVQAALDACMSSEADAIILACTELPIAIQGMSPPGAVLIDSTAALAQSCVSALAG